MSFSRYKKVKKQVSTDRGVTWKDTEPLEYCDPILIDVYPTLDECETEGCTLDEYRYDLIDVAVEDIPKMCTEAEMTICCDERTKVLHATSWYVPEGIVKHVLFSDFYGYTSDGTYMHKVPLMYWDSSLVECGHILGMKRIGTWSEKSEEFDVISGDTIDGKEVAFFSSFGCGCLPSATWECHLVDYCVTVDEFMPWVGDTVKIIKKSHWTRESCDSEWIQDMDYGDKFIGFGERYVMKYVYGNGWYYSRVHQIVDTESLKKNDYEGEKIDSSSGSQEGIFRGIDWVNVDWEDEGVPTLTSEEIPHPQGAVALEYVDGSNGYGFNEYGEVYGAYIKCGVSSFENTGIVFNGNGKSVVISGTSQCTLAINDLTRLDDEVCIYELNTPYAYKFGKIKGEQFFQYFSIFSEHSTNHQYCSDTTIWRYTYTPTLKQSFRLYELEVWKRGGSFTFYYKNCYTHEMIPASYDGKQVLIDTNEKSIYLPFNEQVSSCDFVFKTYF